MKFLNFCFLLIVLSHLGVSQEQPDEYFMRFDPNAVTGPKVLDFQFGRSEAWVLNQLHSQGMEINKKSEDENMRLSKWFVSGTPHGLTVSKGKTQFVFFKNRLIQMRVNFNPSYENFLMVREQLLSSLGTRFQVENEQVAMDNLLKAHLSSLGRNVFNATSDEAVSKALQRGNTYWYYKIKDTTDTLSVILSYRSVKESDHLRRPELELFYAWKKGVDSWKTYEEAQKVTILPD
jgi:hypothetical protein